MFRPLVTSYRRLNLFTIQKPTGLCSIGTTEFMWMDVWLIIADVNIAFLLEQNVVFTRILLLPLNNDSGTYMDILCSITVIAYDVSQYLW